MKLFARITPLILLSLISYQSFGEEVVDDSPKKEGLDYISVNALVLSYRSLGDSNEEAETYATSFTMGTYITNYVKVETRFGVGLGDDTIPGIKIVDDKIVQSDGKVDVDYFASWYMGLHYPLAPWSSIYGLVGFSYIDGDASADEGSTNEEFADDYLTSSFSMSWIVGLDYELTKEWYVTGEIGRLHKSTVGDIDILHYGLGLKYEF